MEVHNPNCDGARCVQETGEVRRVPTGGDGAAILCHACYRHEMQFRQERNPELSPDVQFDIPSWESLEVYAGV